MTIKTAGTAGDNKVRCVLLHLFYFLSILFSLLNTCLVSSGIAAESMVIRDAETENILQVITTPLLRAAGMTPETVRIFILSNKSPNAFVTEHLHLFVHTGLILKSENVNQLTGVLAHEIGHISGGHLVNLREKAVSVQVSSLLAMIAGAATALATQSGSIGAGITMAGQSMIMRDLFSFSRMQEAAADQAAVRLLDMTQQSAKGLIDFFSILGNQELLLTHQQDPYIRTHPLTSERIEFLRHHVETSSYSAVSSNPTMEEYYQRVRIKLLAFMEPTSRRLLLYTEEKNSIYSRYARSIIFYRKADLTRALPLIDWLISDYPSDPYFPEMKGQMLFENGRLAEATTAYQQAVSLMPNHALLRASLARVLIEREETGLLDEAIRHLTIATGEEPGSALFWHFLSIAYGRKGNSAMAAYAMAEHAMLTGKPIEAYHHARQAIKLLPEKAPSALRAQDIKTHVEYLIKRKELLSDS